MGRSKRKGIRFVNRQFSDVVTAIEYIQEKQGIAGTTAREASSTISGSIGMVKAAWENLMSGLADPDADISELASNLVESVATVGENLLPAIEQFGAGFGEAMQVLAPKIISGIPTVISTVLPQLVSSAVNMISVLGQTLVSTAPQLMQVGMQLMQSLISGVQNNLPGMIATAMNALMSFSGKFREGAGKFIDLGLQLIKSIAEGIIQNIPTFIETVPTIVSNFANVINDNAPKVVSTGISILKSLALGIIQAIPVLIANLPKILKAIVDVFMAFQWLSLGRFAISGIAKGLRAAGGALKGAVMKPINAVKSTISGGFQAAKNKAVSMMEALRSGVANKINAARDVVKRVVDKIKGFFPLKAGKIFSGLKLPHFSVSGGKFPFGVAGKGSVPKWNVSWYKKAMDNPYMFSDATLIGAGEAGDEVLYGRNALMRDIREATGDSGRSVVFYNTFNIDGAKDPELYAQVLVKEMQMQMRMV